MVQTFTSTSFFDQVHIESIERAIDNAWGVLQRLEPQYCTEEGKKILALCVLAIAREGEDNQLRLVNRSIVRYRAQCAQNFSEARRLLRAKEQRKTKRPARKTH